MAFDMSSAYGSGDDFGRGFGSGAKEIFIGENAEGAGSIVGKFLLKFAMVIFFWALFGFIYSGTLRREWSVASDEAREYTSLERMKGRTSDQEKRMQELEADATLKLDEKLGMGDAFWISLVTWSTFGYGGFAPIARSTRTAVSIQIALMLAFSLFFA